MSLPRTSDPPQDRVPRPRTEGRASGARRDPGLGTEAGPSSSTTSGPEPDAAPVKPRITRACAICNKRKIRCQYADNASKCSNCLAFDYECIPHERKRKRYTIVDDDDLPSQRKVISIPSDAAPKDTALAVQQQVIPQRPAPESQSLTPQDNLDFVQSALVSQFGLTGQQDRNAHPSVSPASNLAATPGPGSGVSPSVPASVGYLGRSKYVGGELLDQEDAAPKETPLHVPHALLTPDDMRILEIRRAFELPSRATCESLITTFMTKCDPWMPVLSHATSMALQHGRMTEVPLILLQAVLMAGSRMQTERSPLHNITTQQLYDRAKVLFFMGYEKDPMTVISAATILQYWNPTGPAIISIHSSSYWLRVAVNFVHQMGLHKEPDRKLPDWQLRRRIFWTLFSRDSLLSMGQGRPRAIHLEDCSVEVPSPSDFAAPDSKQAQLFIAHVRISGILGDLTQWSLRGGHDTETRTPLFESKLVSWLESLPPALQILDAQGNPNPYDVDARLLAVPYLTAISILHKPKLPSRTSAAGPHPTMASTIACSAVARIFEDALARNEVRNGVAMSAIYLLIAGIGLLTVYEYPLLWRISMHEIQVVKMALEDLSKSWQTARETLRVLQRLQDAVSAFPKNASPPPFTCEGLNWDLFRPFGGTFSAKMQPVLDNWAENPTFVDVADATVAGSTSDRASVSYHAPVAGVTPSVMMGSSLGYSPGLQPYSIDGTASADLDMSPQALMDNVLQDMLAGSHFSGEDWFFQSG